MSPTCPKAKSPVDGRGESQGDPAMSSENSPMVSKEIPFFDFALVSWESTDATVEIAGLFGWEDCFGDFDSPRLRCQT